MTWKETMRAIGGQTRRLVWPGNRTYRTTPPGMTRAKWRNLKFGRKAVGNTTPIERVMIKAGVWDA